jgi:N-acetylmuramoyl-L-alanine amidase
MYPVSETWQKSNALGDKLIEGLQANNVKIFESGSMEMDLTQTSYSKVPSIDIELGDKTSDHSDDALAILCKGLCDGIDLYFAANPKNPQQTIPAETESSVAGSQSTEAVPAEETTAD